MPDGSTGARLEQLRANYPPADAEMIGTIVREVLTTMRGDLTANETSLLAEIEELANTVANARAEISAIGAEDINESHIPSATDELDAIVAHTAEATNGILECCETIDTVIPRLNEEDSAKMQDVVTKIYESCSFQDITGQRITKVVATLKTIEAKVAHITDMFAIDSNAERRQPAGGTAAPAAPTPTSPADPNAGLLNGPQLPTNAMDQSTIDALLASFD
jgi:chemotaxis protein CheZ